MIARKSTSTGPGAVAATSSFAGGGACRSRGGFAFCHVGRGASSSSSRASSTARAATTPPRLLRLASAAARWPSALSRSVASLFALACGATSSRGVNGGSGSSAREAAAQERGESGIASRASAPWWRSSSGRCGCSRGSSGRCCGLGSGHCCGVGCGSRCCTTGGRCGRLGGGGCCGGGGRPGRRFCCFRPPEKRPPPYVTSSSSRTVRATSATLASPRPLAPAPTWDAGLRGGWPAEHSSFLPASAPRAAATTVSAAVFGSGRSSVRSNAPSPRRLSRKVCRRRPRAVPLRGRAASAASPPRGGRLVRHRDGGGCEL